jgi:hypothetical protein
MLVAPTLFLVLANFRLHKVSVAIYDDDITQNLNGRVPTDNISITLNRYQLALLDALINCVDDSSFLIYADGSGSELTSVLKFVQDEIDQYKT